MPSLSRVHAEPMEGKDTLSEQTTTSVYRRCSIDGWHTAKSSYGGWLRSDHVWLCSQSQREQLEWNLPSEFQIWRKSLKRQVEKKPKMELRKSSVWCSTAGWRESCEYFRSRSLLSLALRCCQTLTPSDYDTVAHRDWSKHLWLDLFHLLLCCVQSGSCVGGGSRTSVGVASSCGRTQAD